MVYTQRFNNYFMGKPGVYQRLTWFHPQQPRWHLSILRRAGLWEGLHIARLSSVLETVGRRRWSKAWEKMGENGDSPTK